MGRGKRQIATDAPNNRGGLPTPTPVRASELRASYLSYFIGKGHQLSSSGSLIPTDDPSVLLTTAGMQPLKPFFLGLREPPDRRLTSVQKCFRTTDIDCVGETSRHLTFFEMLGNFSFGDYFKNGAIEMAFEFATRHMGLDPERLYATVYRGNLGLGIDVDEASITAWNRVGIPPVRITRLGEDNFWSAGETGPCGPCSELYYDRGETHGCGNPDCAPGCDCDRFWEFWNLVFTEFDRHADGQLVPLPRKNIDTGLGLERAAAILQETDSVFEIDIFKPIMDWISVASDHRHGEESAIQIKARRVLADHARGAVFLAADGVRPGNTGRNYVLRRVIRRAALHGSRLGIKAPFLAQAADVVIESMGDDYPELRAQANEIKAILTAEEKSFSRTLARGLRLFEKLATSETVSGEVAFFLHDTYGFPLELTRELAQERKMIIDEEDFTRRMAEQRRRSQAAAKKPPMS